MTPVLEVEEPSTTSTSLSAYGIARSTIQGSPLSSEELRKAEAYCRACKYLALGMIDLQANPLLKEALKPEHIKNRLLGHWGSSPGLAFMYIHLNRLIKKFDLDMIFMAGPRGGPPPGSGPGGVLGKAPPVRSPQEAERNGRVGVLHNYFFPRWHRRVRPPHA